MEDQPRPANLSSLLEDARRRLVETGTVERFTAEAKASLPVPIGREDLGAIFMGLQARRFAIRADQQVA
ncbi:MAG: hypothetical protein LC732_08165, partial [Acidobacteria bacterium]|nr:hypothetical protein [Acidobacteriota bacterium]